MIHREQQTMPLVVTGLAVAIVGMLFHKSTAGSDYRIAGMAVATFVVLALTICASGPLAFDVPPPYMLNPTGLIPSWDYFFVGISVIVLGGEVLNNLLDWFEAHVLKVPHMDTSKAKGKLEVFTPIDYCVVACNTFSHFIVVSHLVNILLGPDVEKRFGSFTIINGPVSFVVTVLFNDLLYWCGHGSMHLRAFYPYVHKQHHRQFVPFRGMVDALNVHPFEEFLGASLFGASLIVVSKTVGMHAGTAWILFVVWSIFNILNHFDFDSPMHVPVIFPSGPRDHQMHHRVPQCNYCKLTMFWDRLFNTYLPYTEMADGKKSELTGPKFPISEALPSPGCVLPLMPLIALAATIVEKVCTSNLPATGDVLQMVPSLVLVAVVAVACGLHRKKYQISGAAPPQEQKKTSKTTLPQRQTTPRQSSQALKSE